MKTKLTERDLSRIVRRVINEQDNSNNFCEDAVVDTNHVNNHLGVLEDITKMKERFDKLRFNFDCNLDAVMTFILMFEPIVQKYNELTDLDIEGIDIEEYIKYIRDRFVD